MEPRPTPDQNDDDLRWPPAGYNRFGAETRYAGTEYGEQFDLSRTPGIGPGFRRLLILGAFTFASWMVIWAVGRLLWWLLTSSTTSSG